MPASEDINVTSSDLTVFYSRYFAYYNTLDARYQALFTARCLKFMSEKTIAGAEGFVPDNRVKALVAASAVQLTLGLETWDLVFFETIILHPSDFDNAQTALKYSGETNLSGVIRLSWRKFIRGYEIKHDNLNLGLHEFSHALRLNGIKGSQQDYFTEHYFYSWLASAHEAFEDIRQNRTTIFRKYGGANINEFISVCIEHYFESPNEIKTHYPLLYYSTAILLNQMTDGVHTTVGIRQQAFRQKNELMPGFSEQQMRQRSVNVTSLILFCLFGWSLWGTGLGWLSTALFVLTLFSFLRTDYLFTQINLSGKELQIQKGLLVFKDRKTWTFQISQLISARILDTARYNCQWELIFYNSENDFFYSEVLTSHRTKDAFVKELFANKVAYFS